jgi:ADP-heptose:LPS heptosyltransferase
MSEIKFILRLISALVVGYFRGGKTVLELRAIIKMAIEAGSWQLFRLKMVEEIIQPNYRLRETLKLGAPSTTVYRKYYSDFKSSQSFLSLKSIRARQCPRFLIIRDAAMGDVLMLTPAIRALHVLHQGEIIIDIATKSEHVFNNSPYINEVVNSSKLSVGIRHYDAVFNLNAVYERSPNCHPVDVYGRFLLGDRDFDRQINIFPDGFDRDHVDQVVKMIDSRYLVVHYLGHEWPNREVNMSIWETLLATFKAVGNLKVVFVGAHNDHVSIKNANFLDHRGRYSIQQLKLLIDRSIGFLGGDSGPSHVAAATNAPMAVFYTCAHHEARMPLRNGGKFMPLMPNVDCYGCLTRNPIPRPGYHCERGDNACTSGFDVEKIKLQIINFFEIQT